MRGALLAACVLAALVLMPSSWVAAQETTHEILVGYSSEQDRRDAEKELTGARDKLKVRGQSLESLQVQAIGEKILKLRSGCHGAQAKSRTPSAETSILGARGSTEASDKHRLCASGWVMGGCRPQRGPSLSCRARRANAAKAFARGEGGEEIKDACCAKGRLREAGNAAQRDAGGRCLGVAVVRPIARFAGGGGGGLELTWRASARAARVRRDGRRHNAERMSPVGRKTMKAHSSRATRGALSRRRSAVMR
jgi:hypothetical protein